MIHHAHYISLFYVIRPTSENWLLRYWSWPLSDAMGNKIHGADVSITNAFDHFFWSTVFYCLIVFYLFIFFFHIQLYPYYHHYIIVIILLFRLRVVKRTSTHVRILLRRTAHASIRVWWQTMMMMIIIILRFW